MQDQAIGYDNSGVPADRWSAWAYVITGLGLAGILVAILLLATGRSHSAEFVAIVSFAVQLIYSRLATGYGQARASENDGSVESLRAAISGLFAALAFLAICYWANIWPLTGDAPVTFSHSGLGATFWIAVSMIQSIPRAYRIWRTSPRIAPN